jgi:hypothetical protein
MARKSKYLAAKGTLMPYIKPDRRAKLDAGIGPVLLALMELWDEDNEGKENYEISVGDVNYIFTRIIDRIWGGNFTNYASMNEALGLLEAVKLEFYRRRMSPYEDKKIAQNGDVYP